MQSCVCEPLELRDQHESRELRFCSYLILNILELEFGSPPNHFGFDVHPKKMNCLNKTQDLILKIQNDTDNMPCAPALEEQRTPRCRREVLGVPGMSSTACRTIDEIDGKAWLLYPLVVFQVAMKKSQFLWMQVNNHESSRTCDNNDFLGSDMWHMIIICMTVRHNKWIYYNSLVIEHSYGKPPAFSQVNHS